MGLWTDYTKKDTPEDNDTLMLYDAAGKANKQTLFSGFWKWVAKKLKEATLSDLKTTNKTMIGAINELNSNKQSALKNIGKQYLANELGVITTEIDRKAIIVSCRSNNAIVEPFVSIGTNYWNAAIRGSDGYPVSDKNIYITFFYFE